MADPQEPTLPQVTADQDLQQTGITAGAYGGRWWCFKGWDQWLCNGRVAWLLGIIGVGALVAVFIWHGYSWDWTGFGLDTGPEKIPPIGAGGERIVLVQVPRRLWDWMSAFGVPVAVVIVGSILARQQAVTEREIAHRRRAEELIDEEQRNVLDQMVAKSRRQQEQASALNQQRQTTLDVYLDRISDLLLNGKLKKNNEDGLNVARVRTLTALRQLDGGRKGVVMRFLMEANLIRFEEGADPLLYLAGADLSNADLRDAYLLSVNLARADLHQADLSDAILGESELTAIKLTGANLSRADLSNAILAEADLQSAKLSEAELTQADLRFAKMEGCNLSGASLGKAQLFRSDLSLANLTGADMTEADVRQANLSHAIVDGAIWDSARVKGAILDGATLGGKPITIATLVACGAIAEDPPPWPTRIFSKRKAKSR